jgi:excisionase family DNA binding protein
MPNDQTPRPDSSAVTNLHAAGPDPSLAEIRFFTVAEVAEVMRVSRMTVYRLVHSGELPAVRVGRSFRVPQHAVHEYLRAAYTDAG